jgi:glucose/arabinose dehydrogenase
MLTSVTKSLFIAPQTSIYIGIFTLLILFSGCTTSATEIVPTTTSVPVVSSPEPSATPTTLPATLVNTSTPQPTSTAVSSPTQSPSPTNVQSLPNPEEFNWQVVTEGVNQPTGMVSSLDGSGRMFVLEQAGLIRIFQDGELLSDPFLDLRERVSMRGSTTAGLLGLAFHPRYAENGYFFIHYTETGGESMIARYQTTKDTGAGDPDSELRLLEISFPVGEHKGGDLAFGPDGYLYISVGDGGAGGYGDQEGNAQNPGTLLGSILRIDVDNQEPYGVPPDNPFVSGGGLPEVWAYGLRNPWRFTFDRLTGDMYISDVGENRWEEINFLPDGTPGGANFGWSYLEGTATYKERPPENLELVYPAAQYDHTQGCSVTGGVVYRGAALPEWHGVYIYGDFCQGNVWGLLKMADGSWENELLHKVQGFITSFGQDEEGEVYLVDLSGKIYKLVRK